MVRSLFVLILVVILVSGCSLFAGDAAENEATPGTATVAPGGTPTSAVTPAAGATPEATQVVAPQEQPPIRIWVVEELSPAANVPGGSILAEQLEAYETNHPDVQIDVEVKTGSGRGGILSYLRNGPNVAPSILPDLIGVPVALLAPAANEGLIHPLNDHVEPADWDDLFPAAQDLGRVNDVPVGYPMTLSNLTHLAYSTGIFTETVPLIWDDFIEPGEAVFAFPGAGQPGAELLLQFYLAEGGALTNESNLPALQFEPLVVALDYFSRGRFNGAIPVESSGLTSLAESWQLFGGAANSVQTTYSLYSTLRDEGPDSTYAGIPGPAEPLAPLVKGWAWAVSAPDPLRQETAADIMNWLAAGPNMGDWSLAADRLPARFSAFEQWPGGDDYALFMQQELERAEPFPAIANGPILEALGTALFDVLSLASSPEAAAQQAVDSLQP